MKHNVMLTIASLLSILFMTFHLTDDILRQGGMAQAGATNLIAVPILVFWLYGTLVLAERKSGYIIMLVGALGGLGMPVLHMALARAVIANELARTRRLPLRLDAPRGRCDRALLPHPLGARTVEPAMGPAPVVQQPEHEKACRTA
jgi:hypothetical protein